MRGLYVYYVFGLIIVALIFGDTRAADPTCQNGVSNVDGACCTASCGTCGGAGCTDRPGGLSNCCTTPISESGRSCDSFDAPCMMTPTNEPTKQPTKQPTNEPTKQPTKQPTNEPTKQPTKQPTNEPTKQPTKQPTNEPTKQPTKQPTNEPTNEPTLAPSTSPTLAPSHAPSRNPTASPSKRPNRDRDRLLNPEGGPSNTAAIVGGIFAIVLGVAFVGCAVGGKAKFKDYTQGKSRVDSGIFYRSNSIQHIGGDGKTLHAYSMA